MRCHFLLNIFLEKRHLSKGEHVKRGVICLFLDYVSRFIRNACFLNDTFGYSRSHYVILLFLVTKPFCYDHDYCIRGPSGPLDPQHERSGCLHRKVVLFVGVPTYKLQTAAGYARDLNNMSSYGGAWDGGPPGAEGEYAPAAPPVAPATDPWTGVSYSQYGASYDYSQYGAYYGGYEPAAYYQQQQQAAGAGAYYPGSGAAPYPQPPSFEYKARPPEREQRRSYNSKSRTPSPYGRRERSYSRKRSDSYEDERRRHSRSISHRKKYSSSDRSRSRSYSRSKNILKKKRRSSSGSSVSKESFKKNPTTSRRSERSLTPPSKVKSSRSHKRSVTPGTPDSIRKRSVSKSRNSKRHSSVEKKTKDRRRDVVTPPSRNKKSTPPRGKKFERSSVSPPRSYKLAEREGSLTPPRSYKYKERSSVTPPRKTRDSSITPPKSYARNSSTSSKSRSASPRPRRKKARGGQSAPTSSSDSDSSKSSCRSRSKRKTKRKSDSKHRSRSRSRSTRRSRSKSITKAKKRSDSSKRSQSRSRSCSKNSHSGTPSEDERRGQFTVSDRKRFWKQHRSRIENKETKTPPKEIKPPPGAVESSKLDDIEYGDPPDVVGPNFAELLSPPDLAALNAASTSRARVPVPIPIKNDGSFLEMFKKMQEATKKIEEEKKPVIKKPILPFIGKRRGGRVLKTGLVKKAKAIDEQTIDNTPKDAWSLYMQEVKKYRETSCEEERKTRPLVK